LKGGHHLRLAECYWKLGAAEMAKPIVAELARRYTSIPMMIKLCSDMGELDQALMLAKRMARTRPDAAWLAAADTYRFHQKYDKAIEYYRKVLAVKRGGRRLRQNQDRAAASLQAVQVFEALDLSKIADGTYAASSIAYAGPLQVAVVVKAGRIVSVRVTRHRDKQYYTSITDTTSQIVAKQSVKGIDATTGATITAEAIVNATAKALAKGLK